MHATIGEEIEAMAFRGWVLERVEVVGEGHDVLYQKLGSGKVTRALWEEHEAFAQSVGGYLGVSFDQGEVVWEIETRWRRDGDEETDVSVELLGDLE